MPPSRTSSSKGLTSLFTSLDAPLTLAGTAAEAEGDRVGVLLVHGFTGTPASMRPWAEHLHEAGYAVRVPLLPGHATRWQDLNRTTYADWYAEAERALDDLLAECDHVFVGGLSMGGALTLNLAMDRGRDIAGIILVNPLVSLVRKDQLLLPVLKRFVPAFPGIGSDVKKQGVVETTYRWTPLKAAHSLFSSARAMGERLPEVTQPLLLFRSRVDHVIDPSSGRAIMSRVSSRDLEERILEESFHVATLDNDAPAIFEGSVAFIQRISSARATSSA